jgi:uncharacterized membrane protein
MSAHVIAPPAPAATSRLTSIDVVRGAVMVLMAIDHVRVYSGLPAGGITPGIFFTRWVTHFCAPAFIFLAGTSAFLYGRRHDDLPRFLLTRGLWLVFLELTYFRVCWTFNLEFRQYEMAGVIWVIGWCMVLMAALVRLPIKAIAGIGLTIIGLHNLLDPMLTRELGTDAVSNLWRIAYVGFYAGPVRLGTDGPSLMVLYSIVPWIGVMAAGYAFGAVVTLASDRRRQICLRLGGAAILLFVMLRTFNLYGDPSHWSPGGRMPAALSFLATTKYPASLDFLLMTLGPTVLLLGVLEPAGGRPFSPGAHPMARVLDVFGRVPFFYYALHIPLIHVLAIVVSLVRAGDVNPWLFTNHPMGNPPPPDGYTWSLPLLYLVWAAAIAILYPACRWYADLKAGSASAWLRFI